MIKSVRSRWPPGFCSYEVTLWPLRAQDPEGRQKWCGVAKLPHTTILFRSMRAMSALLAEVSGQPCLLRIL